MSVENARRPGRGIDSRSPGKARLLDVDLCAGFFQFLLGGVGLGLGSAFEHGFGSAFDQRLGLGQAQPGLDLADGLDDGDLLVRGGGEKGHVEGGLGLGGSGGGPGGSPTRGGVSNLTVINCTFNNTEQGIRIKSDRDRGGFLHNLSYLNLRMTNVGCPILIYASYMATNKEYRNLNNVTAAIAAGYPSSTVGNRTPIYRDIVFSNITATVQSGRRAGLIWGLPEMAVTNVLLQQVNITADKPFGIYDAQNVRLVDSKIITPDGVNQLSCTNADMTISETGK